jgi:hypothetical protein
MTLQHRLVSFVGLVALALTLALTGLVGHAPSATAHVAAPTHHLTAAKIIRPDCEGNVACI